MNLSLQYTKTIIKYLSKSEKVKTLLMPIYEKLGVKAAIHKNRTETFSKHGFEVLRKITVALNKKEVKYWLDYGTLLGIIRNQGILKHDDDIDLGMMATDYSEEIDEIFLKEGFILVSTVHLKQDNTLVQKVFTFNEVRVDLFFYFKAHNKMFSYAADNRTYLLNKYHLKQGEYLAIKSAFSYQTTKQIRVNGACFSIPSAPRKYLQEAYGDWETENKNFDYLFDSKAVVIDPEIKATMFFYA